MTVTATRGITDETKRLIDTVCRALRAVQLNDIGEVLQKDVFGTGRMFTRKGEVFEFTLTGELMMRQLLDACVRPRTSDAQRRADCLTAIRAAGFRV